MPDANPTAVTDVADSLRPLLPTVFLKEMEDKAKEAGAVKEHDDEEEEDLKRTQRRVKYLPPAPFCCVSGT